MSHVVRVLPVAAVYREARSQEFPPRLNRPNRFENRVMLAGNTPLMSKMS